MSYIAPLTNTPSPVGMASESEDLDQQREAAMIWALQWVSLFDSIPKRAAIFDIDSTLLHGEEDIVSVQRAFRALRNNGVAVFAVTARSSLHEDVTWSDLCSRNLRPAHLYMHDESEPLRHADDAALQKRKARSRIERDGYCVLLSVGDAWGDHDVRGRSEFALSCPKAGVLVWVEEESRCAHVKLPTLRKA